MHGQKHIKLRHLYVTVGGPAQKQSY